MQLQTNSPIPSRINSVRTFHSVSSRLILMLFSSTSVKYAFLLHPQGAIFSGHFIVLQSVTLYNSMMRRTRYTTHYAVLSIASFFFLIWSKYPPQRHVTIYPPQQHVPIYPPQQHVPTYPSSVLFSQCKASFTPLLITGKITICTCF
jgi:hypothetical protein